MAYPEPTRCGATYFGSRATCDLQPKHVKSETDWHQSVIESKTFQEGATLEITIVQTETVRWAPNMFEIPSNKDEDEK